MSAYEAVLLDRVRELIGYRKWIRLLLAHSPDRAPYWKPLDAEYRVELLALVRLARQARKLERAARPFAADFVDHAADATWTNGELAEAWGK